MSLNYKNINDTARTGNNTIRDINHEKFPISNELPFM